MANEYDLRYARTKLFDSAVEVVKENLNINDVFDDKQISDFVGDRYSPEEIFTKRQLEGWALENGFIKKDVNNG